jgi:hypothetical protein
MAHDPYPSWAAEQYGTNRLPSIWSAFLLFGVLAALALALFNGPTATAESGQQPRPPTFCEEHRGQPAWDSVCAETARRRR